jgi:hypothetical protein
MVNRHFKKGADHMDDTWPNGRPSILSEDEHEDLINMDEMGDQDWADRTEKTCLVPASHPTKQVYIPVSRTGKRIPLMAAMAADGSVLKPEIVIPRKTVDADLLLTGLTSEKVTVRSQRTASSQPRALTHGWRRPFCRSSPFVGQSTSTPGQPYSSLTSAPLISVVDSDFMPRCGRWHALLHNTGRPREAIASSPPVAVSRDSRYLG